MCSSKFASDRLLRGTSTTPGTKEMTAASPARSAPCSSSSPSEEGEGRGAYRPSTVAALLVGTAAVASFGLAASGRSTAAGQLSVVEPILTPLLGGPAPPAIGETYRSAAGWLSGWNSTAQSYFERCLALLLGPGLLIFLYRNVLAPLLLPRKPRFVSETVLAEPKPTAVRTFQLLYLPVFWLLRTAFWMSGPYFFPVYASKVTDLALIGRIFSAGFAAAALFLPLVAKVVSASYTDERTGTIFAAIFYGLGALSTQSSDLRVLLAGRGLGGIGTGLLGVMPEAWLSSEVQKGGADPYGRWLAGTFGTAYAFDSIVAIGAGQLASYAAERLGGPVGPFKASPIFLAVAIVIVGLFWTDSDVPTKDGEGQEKDEDGSNGLSIKGAVKVILSDPKIVMVGLVQCLFEAAMYIFVLEQAPAVRAAASDFFGEDAGAVPSGLVFCCFMACCLLGSNLYGSLADRQVRPERAMTAVTAIAAASLIGTSCVVSGAAPGTGLVELTAAFFVFELCVGVYYPSISWLRSKYLPVRHRSVIMTIVFVPFNLLVLTISTLKSTGTIGATGAWATASALLLLSTACLVQLQRIARREAIENLPRTWKRIKAKWIGIARVIQIRKMVQGIASQAAEENYE